MKITHVAFAATILLVGAAIYLLMDARAAKDKELLSNEINKMKSDMAEMRKQPPVIPGPADAKTTEAPTESTSTGPDKAVGTPAATKEIAKTGVPPKTSGSAPIAKANANPSQASPNAPQPVAVDPNAKGTAAAQGTDVTLPNPLDELNLTEEERKALAEAGASASPAAVPATAASQKANKTQTMIRGLSAIAEIKSIDDQFGFVVLNAGSNRGLEKGKKFSVRRTGERGEVMIVGKITIGQTVNTAECIADVDPKSVPLGVTIQAGDQVVLYE